MRENVLYQEAKTFILLSAYFPFRTCFHSGATQYNKLNYRSLSKIVNIYKTSTTLCALYSDVELFCSIDVKCICKQYSELNMQGLSRIYKNYFMSG